MDNFSTKLLTGASAGLAAVALAAVAVQSGENIFNWQCFWLTGLIFLFATSALRRVRVAAGEVAPVSSSFGAQAGPTRSTCYTIRF